MSLTQAELDQLDLLKRQRSSYKGQLTNFKNKYGDSDTLNIGSCESVLHRLRIIYNKYDEIQSKIELLDVAAVRDRETFEDDYGQLESGILNVIHEIKKPEPSNISFQNNSVLDCANPSSSSIEMRMPEIKLPSFSGKQYDWLRFRDIFEELVHKKNIDKSIKFHYLISHVSGGTAYSLIEGIPVTSANYDLAWTTIYDKYNNEVTIQRTYLKQLYDIKPTVPHSSESLQAFIDEAVKNYNSLKALHVPVESWNLILIHHLSEKLDNASRTDVIKGSSDKTVINFNDFIKILQNRVRVLAALKPITSTSATIKPKTSSVNFKNKRNPATLMSSIYSCSYCHGNHSIDTCLEFCDPKLTPKMRFHFIKQKRLCTNCLSSSHSVRNCNSNGCSKCALKHHNLLHFNFDRQPNQAVTKQSEVTHGSINVIKDAKQSRSNIDSPNMHQNQESNIQRVMLATCKDTTSINYLQSVNKVNQMNSLTSSNQIMLGTAIVKAFTSTGNHILARILLDSGSHLNFVTDKACSLLNLKLHPTEKQVAGMGNKITTLKHKVYISLGSRTSEYKINLKCYVLPKITGELPLLPINLETTTIPSHLQLADPQFNIPDRIDILIGAEVYHELFTGKSFKLCNELPMFYDSVFGYVLSGKMKLDKFVNVSIPHQITLSSIEVLETSIKKFWELETVTSKTNYSLEEKLCEDHFRKNVKRLTSGRYSVAIPVNTKIAEIGSSSEIARRQFFNIEKQLCRNPIMYQQYKDFMNEYLQLNHMEIVENSSIIQSQYNKAYYLPHHCVTKSSSTTTKLRVVFNASCKSSSQISLNDCMMVGPVVQTDLFSLVLRFRKYKFAFSADIAKMYRQILIHENQRDLLRIWWRNSITEPLKCYRLRTVTYGTASAPYLATRTLNQLAADVTSFPQASKVLTNDFYVDDVLTGADTIEKAISLKEELIQLLTLGGFNLRKFSSNVPELADDNPTSHLSLILGLMWNTDTDTLEVSFEKINFLNTTDTKRKILSEICQLFDPLGLCAPLILTAKLFMQELWTLSELKWDDNLPESFIKNWSQFKEQLIQLNHISVPRSIVQQPYTSIELHGFGDASEVGFGCVFYIRTTDKLGIHRVNLVCSKSRVAPLKKQTIPRLELCAALLLAQFSHKLLSILKIHFDFVYLWSDSEITLLRIKSEPHRYATFVANRITQIQELTSIDSWHYVPTALNPADYVSRGLFPNEFSNATTWWSGPEYLSKNRTEWPQTDNKILSSKLIDQDLRNNVSSYVVTMPIKFNLIQKYSSFRKLINVTAYVVRFFNNVKTKNIKLRINGELTSNEISIALQALIKRVQYEEFSEDIIALRSKNYVSNKSLLKSLSPFVDSNGLIRVGGRLKNADVPQDQKYPILLPSKHYFTVLLVRDTHNRLLHAGPQALLYYLRLTYWIISGRNLCRKICNNCVRCARVRPSITNQIMGDLPKDRVQSSRPFSIVGIDFCGPFFMKYSIRAKIKTKIYICLFVCFAVKAIHLEIVPDLTTQAFLACFRRFVSRRGMCTKIYSDNATNFVGARSELKELRELFLSESCQSEIMKFCSFHNMEWITIPPRSPHFGGLWEAAIKSAKYHLRRSMGTHCFTLDEFQTLVVQIEACLNSRPLTPMSNNPLDMSALSPGHFLIGAPMTAIPEPSVVNILTNRLSRYQLLQQVLQQFWKRWHAEYLTELQNRYKWNKPMENVKIGALVILHDDHLPPMYWQLGRVIELHFGSDDRVRVVTVKTSQSIFKRAITKISVLPVENNYETDQQTNN